MIIFVIIVILAYVMKSKTIENLTPINVSPTLTREEFVNGHGSEDLSTKMQHLQQCESAKDINQQFVSMESDFHNGNVNDTILCIKVSFTFLKKAVRMV